MALNAVHTVTGTVTGGITGAVKRTRNWGKKESEKAKIEVNPQDNFNHVEIDRLRIAFNMFAKGKDGVLLKADVPQALKALALVLTQRELDQTLRKMDVDKTGKIDFPAFFSALAGLLKPVLKDEAMENAFVEISGWGREHITSRKLLETMSRLQPNMTQEDCEAMIREVDRSGNHKISKEDFVLEMSKY